MLNVFENPTLLAVWVAASSVIAIHSAKTAKRMPAEQGGIAGWLRWYLVMATLVFVVNIVYFASGAAPLVAAISVVLECPTSIALWIKKHTVRILALWCFYGYAVCVGVLLIVEIVLVGFGDSGDIRLEVREVSHNLMWGTYFLRSKRVKATYLRAERKRETRGA